MKMLGIPVLATLLSLTLSPALAQQSTSVYRWTDKDGVVHFDDKNSSGRRVTRDLLKDRAIPAHPSWSGRIPPAIVEEVRLACKIEQDRLHSYQSAAELYGRDPSGNLYRMSPRQASLEIAQLKKEVDYYCAPGAASRVYKDRQAERAAEQRAEELRQGITIKGG